VTVAELIEKLKQYPPDIEVFDGQEGYKEAPIITLSHYIEGEVGTIWSVWPEEPGAKPCIFLG